MGVPGRRCAEAGKRGHLKAECCERERQDQGIGRSLAVQSADSRVAGEAKKAPAGGWIPAETKVWLPAIAVGCCPPLHSLLDSFADTILGGNFDPFGKHGAIRPEAAFGLCTEEQGGSLGSTGLLGASLILTLARLTGADLAHCCVAEIFHRRPGRKR